MKSWHTKAIFTRFYLEGGRSKRKDSGRVSSDSCQEDGPNSVSIAEIQCRSTNFHPGQQAGGSCALQPRVAVANSLLSDVRRSDLDRGSNCGILPRTNFPGPKLIV
jgi:hypothetical protein